MKLIRGFLFCAFSKLKWKMNGVQKSGAPFPKEIMYFPHRIGLAEATWKMIAQLSTQAGQSSKLLPEGKCLSISHVYLRVGASREHYHPQLRMPYPSGNRISVHILSTNDLQSEICVQNNPLWVSPVVQWFSTTFGPGHDPGDLGSSPTSGFLHGACFSLCLCF